MPCILIIKQHIWLIIWYMMNGNDMYIQLTWHSLDPFLGSMIFTPTSAYIYIIYNHIYTSNFHGEMTQFDTTRFCSPRRVEDDRTFVLREWFSLGCSRFWWWSMQQFEAEPQNGLFDCFEKRISTYCIFACCKDRCFSQKCITVVYQDIPWTQMTIVLLGKDLLSTCHTSK